MAAIRVRTETTDDFQKRPSFSDPWRRRGAGLQTSRRSRLAFQIHAQDETADDCVWRFDNERRTTLRMANSESNRLKCWRLVYEEYVEKGYARPDPLGYRYSLHDALPRTGTFLVEVGGEATGTVTVFPDSALGLPADDSYKAELDRLRAAGRRLAEVGRLSSRREHAQHRDIVTSLIELPSLYSRCLLEATDMVITVNPAHAHFYERMMLFERIGEPKTMESVSGAPAVLLRMDLALQRALIRYEHGEGEKPAGYQPRTVYRRFSPLAEEAVKVLRMRRCMRPLNRAFLKRHFAEVRPLLQTLSPTIRRLFEPRAAGYDDCKKE
jgi:hypothetical protein